MFLTLARPGHCHNSCSDRLGGFEPCNVRKVEAILLGKKHHLRHSSDDLARVNLLLPVVIVPQDHHQLGYLLPDDDHEAGDRIGRKYVTYKHSVQLWPPSDD